jgi:uncharacterized protein (TIGR03790 family)
MADDGHYAKLSIGVDALSLHRRDKLLIDKAGPCGRRLKFESLERRELLAADLTAANVLVLYNSASSAGAQIAGYYAQVHPGVRLLGLTGIDPNSEEITADAYLSTIRPQVLGGLTASTAVIVTTKGLPLRIQVTEPAPVSPTPSPPTYVDANGVLRSIFNWQPFSSLESELANIQRVSTWQMMGDQTYNFGSPFARNPYYKSASPFDRAAYADILLTSRLDGYSIQDVTAAIDRAQDVTFGRSGPYFLVDNDPSKSYAPTMAKLLNEVLLPAGLPTVYDNTSAYINSAPGPIIGYDSHGVHQASTPGSYLINGFQPTLAPGAVFTSWESYNAASFTPGGYSGSQGQIAQWLAIGGTVGVGNVSEPGANQYRVANEDQLFKSLIAGRTWAEAAWSSLYQVGYVNTVVGDPLMKWKPANSATVAARQLFYNRSAWDGYSYAVGSADDAAIATDKIPYQPGAGTATFASVSSYVRGINGIMIDLEGTHGAITSNDFIFKVGNNNSTTSWADAPVPTVISVRTGAGVRGSDRVEITWTDNGIRSTWLQATVRGYDSMGNWNTNTGLATTDIFFWGSVPGDTGAANVNGFAVTSADTISARNDPHGLNDLASITNPNDFNRDRQVNSMDQIIARFHATVIGSELAFLSVNASGTFSAPVSTVLLAPSVIVSHTIQSDTPQPILAAPGSAAADQRSAYMQHTAADRTYEQWGARRMRAGLKAGSKGGLF